MSRKQFLCLGIVYVILVTCARVPEKKNVLFILVDDFGYNDISYRNSSFYETPSIDKLAKEAFVFNEGYAACRVCSPSRASILSGKFSARHGITDWIGALSGEAWREKNRFNKLLPPSYEHNLSKNYITLPEALKKEGYTTFFAGKWHLGSEGSWPEDHGFDINIGGWDGGSPNGGYFSPYKNPNLINKKDGENLSMRLAQETVEFIKANQDEKFFAFLSFYAVHGPIETNQEKWAKYREKAERNGIAAKGFEMGTYLPVRQTQDNPVYAGLVSHMDDAVGHVLTSLENLGLDKNTIIIFTSDNGGVSSGDNFSTSNLPLKGGKGSQFEGGIKEPYFIKVPWMEKTFEESDAPVSGTDFYPTILDLLGIELKPEEHNDGISLLPVLKGEDLGEIKDRELIWHYPHYGNQGGEPSSMIRKGDWKLIHYYEDGRDELYNLKDDPGEVHEVSGANMALVENLKRKLFEYLEEVGARYPVKDSLYDAEAEEAYLLDIATKQMRELEDQRKAFLDADFDPENHWWGSQPTED